MIDAQEKPKPSKNTRRRRVRHRLSRGVSAIPSLVTLGNGIAGFAAIHFATKPLTPERIAEGDEAAAAAWIAGNLVIAAWLLFLGMICDALDGRLARLTSQTSDFGAQLDSLCDAISFGVAPAILMLRAVQARLFGVLGEVDVLPQADVLGRAVWLVAAVYVCCAIMRLARFNVETEPEESAHMSFSGLPSPAAAVAVISLVLLHAHLGSLDVGWLSAPWIAQTVIWAMPAVTLAAALLMVSRVPYPHIVNQYFGGRKPFAYIVRLAIIIMAAIVINFEATMAFVAIAYLFSGIVRWLIPGLRNSGIPAPAAETDDDDDGEEIDE